MKLSLGHLCNYFSKLLNPICKGFVRQLAIDFVSMYTRDSFELQLSGFGLSLLGFGIPISLTS